MTWTESAIAASLAGKFYPVPESERTQSRRSPAKWSDQDTETFIRLYRAGAHWVEIMETMLRNPRILYAKYRELERAGILKPRPKGRRPRRVVGFASGLVGLAGYARADELLPAWVDFGGLLMAFALIIVSTKNRHPS